MIKILFFTLFLILIVFSMNQDATAEIEGKENREKAAKEAAEALKRKSINEQPEKISDEVVKEPVIKKKLGKLKKILPTEDEFEEITLRTNWKYVDKQSSSNEEYRIESIQGLLRDVGRVYDPVVNKYKVATIHIEIIKYEDKEKLEKYWINEKKSN